jgi:hypothetical protein
MMHSMVSYGIAALIRRFGSCAGTAVAGSPSSLDVEAFLVETPDDPWRLTT